MNADSLRRRFLTALGIYLLASCVYFAFGTARIHSEHTRYNHFALQADAWMNGRLDLGGPPPEHAAGNDFAEYDDRWYVVFPPFPALLITPVVALSGGAEATRDGQFFLWFAGLGPALLFLALEKLRLTRRSSRTPTTNAGLALLFAFGTVYFFTAEQGTVWFAAHVVSVVLAALYLLFALDASSPVLAGVALGLGFATRTPLAFAFPLFLLEAWRASQYQSSVGHLRSAESGWRARLRSSWRRVDKRRYLALCAWFALPIVICAIGLLALNYARFDDPFEFGYRHLTVRWAERIDEWGLFGFHYLPRNLAVSFTSLPWWTPDGRAPFRINGHGLALWVTMPFYLWLLWPKVRRPLHWALWATVLFVAVPTFFYQNTGWVQFGYRFSNDYAVFLFALLAIGGRRFGAVFTTLAVWAIVVNAFGAWTFGRPKHARFYFIDPTQEILYQPD
jgi:hypothetical protein